MIYYVIFSALMSVIGYYMLSFNNRHMPIWHRPIVLLILFIMSPVIFLILVGHYLALLVYLIDDIYSDSI